ncbi:MAG: HNH endonuclease [Desulfobacteraceae bacterium]|nr:HNH endonuclease [Desulfobacteraceae bacterium]MBC2756697.1 HNH endonuclease [Desulfobacteraceae bacterium]
MADAPKRPCPKCKRVLIQDPAKYCPECEVKLSTTKKKLTRVYDQRRGSASSRGYGRAWQKIRANKLMRYPLCEVCLKEGDTKRSALVHHIDEDPKNNKWQNLLAVCVSCHERIHDRQGRAGKVCTA